MGKTFPIKAVKKKILFITFLLHLKDNDLDKYE